MGTPRDYPCWIFKRKPLVKSLVVLPARHEPNNKTPLNHVDQQKFTPLITSGHAISNSHFDDSPDLKQTEMEQSSEDSTPAHVHPDRLRNFIQQYDDLQPSTTDIPERDFHPQPPVYKIPQRSKIKKKQFLSWHNATNANAIPLGTHKNRHLWTHNNDTELLPSGSNPIHSKDNLDPQAKAESSIPPMTSNRTQSAPTQPATNNNNNILNRATRMAASIFSMSC